MRREKGKAKVEVNEGGWETKRGTEKLAYRIVNKFWLEQEQQTILPTQICNHQ